MRANKIILAILCCGVAFATDYPCAAGATCTLSADVVLSGSDTISYTGSVGSRCTIVGNGHSFTGTTTGAVTMQYCDLKGVGDATHRAITLTASGSQTFLFDHLTWSTVTPSGAVTLTLNGTSTFTFSNNSIPPTGAAYPEAQSSPAEPSSIPALKVSGSSTVAKTIKGNLIQVGWIDASGADSVTVGGTTDADANIVVGLRAGMFMGTNSTMRWNYFHPTHPVGPVGVADNWSELSNVNQIGAGTTARDNITQGGQWDWRQIDATASVHDNVSTFFNYHYNFAGNGTMYNNITIGAFPGLDRYADISSQRTWPEEAFYVPSANSLNMHHNTVDNRNANLGAGSGTGMMVAIQSGSTGNVVQDNAFIGTALASVNSIVDQSEDSKVTNPFPTRATTLDYNAFQYRSGQTRFSNYAISTGGTECSGSWGSHDVFGCSTNTATNVSGSLGLRGPLPVNFPFDDRDIIAGTVTVSAMLDYFRSVYCPGGGSALIAAAHDGTDIGAVQSGSCPAAYTTNLKPSVWAGNNFTVNPRATVNLQGYCGDDGLPSGTLTCNWTKISGPGTFTQTLVGQLHTGVFSADGVYVIRLTGDDGSLTNTQDITLTMGDPPPAVAATKFLISQ